MYQRSKFTALGFTLIELLVVISIIGLLAGLLLPAVQAAREAARATQCINNLRQISLASTLFHDTFGAFPPARYQPRPDSTDGNQCGGSETTWLVRILPFLEQSAAESRWDYKLPYASHDDDTRTFVSPVYVCPTRRSPSDAVGMGMVADSTTTWIQLPCGCMIPIVTPGVTIGPGAVGDYGGNHGDLSPGSFGLPTDFYYGGNGTGIIISSRAKCVSSVPMDWIDKVRMKDVTDGLSNTFLAGEMHVPLGLLKEPGADAFIYNGDHVFNSSRIGGPTAPIVRNIRDTQNGLTSWGSWHPQVCNFTLADGSTRSVSSLIDTETLGYLCNRKDGQVGAISP
jgi:prepilin-type N-terminal cleavage/methylation domain-containing protein